MITFPRYLPFKTDRTYSVLGYIGKSEYKDNKGYLDESTGKIYICSKDNPPVHNDVPIIYVHEDGTYTLHEVAAPHIKEVFREAYLHDLSFTHIIETTDPEEQLYNEEALTDINAATSRFVPTINDTDDPLKKIVKQSIISKGIDINRLKHKMPQKYGLTNMKSALIGTTKMSITNFIIWCELLCLEFEFSVIDNGKDNQNPLQKPITYTSERNRMEF